MEYLLPITAIIGGFILLLWGADRFVYGAAGTANNLGVSPMTIGLTVVGFGTSAPEILVSINAAISGTPGLAVGNAIGSNIANVGLVLGVTALILPLTIRSETLRKEFPLMYIIMLVSLALIFDQSLTRYDGIILLIGLALMMYWIIHTGKSNKDKVYEKEMEQEIPKINLKPAIIWTVFGLCLLLVSSHILVLGAIEIAELLGVSELVIGLTVIAIGTSLPELATSITSVLKNEPDLAIGNIIGSNIFNILAVLGIPALIQPMEHLDSQLISRDFVYMLGLSAAMFLFAFAYRKKQGKIGRIGGFVLLSGYISYLVVLYFTLKPV